MPFEPEWVPLNQRSSDIQDKVAEVYSSYADSQVFREPIDLYLEQEWGSLDQSILYRGLLECKRRQDILTVAAIVDLIPVTAPVEELGAQEDEVEEPIVVTTPNNAQVGQPLKWFRAQPPNSKIKDEAEDQYRLRLLDLYISHVNKTGETYFPRLEQMLRAYAEFYGY